jgi:hypothetical protein
LIFFKTPFFKTPLDNFYYALLSLTMFSDFPPKDAPKLGDVIKKVFIIAHKENVQQLLGAMRIEKFECEEIRTIYTDEQMSYSTNIRCLVNHATAWKAIENYQGYAMVVEADFIPVKHIAMLPLPFVPRPSVRAMAWLYSVGPVIYHADDDGAMYGHNAGTVAYILDSICAHELLSLYEEDMSGANPGRYRPWEVYFPTKLRWERGIRTYIPYRMYGEHGGVPNREHNKHNYRGWHQADVLAGSLHFMPLYSRGSYLRYKLFRTVGWLRGIYKFIRGKYFDTWMSWYSDRQSRMKKLIFVFRRLTTL